MAYDQFKNTPDLTGSIILPIIAPKSRPVIILLAIAILLGGFFVDWFISFFFGPAGCIIAVPLALSIAIVPLFRRRDVSSWFTLLYVALCCVASYAGTAYMLHSRHGGTYTDWLVQVGRYGIELIKMFF